MDQCLLVRSFLVASSLGSVSSGFSFAPHSAVASGVFFSPQFVVASSTSSVLRVSLVRWNKGNRPGLGRASGTSGLWRGPAGSFVEVSTS